MPTRGATAAFGALEGQHEGSAAAQAAVLSQTASEPREQTPVPAGELGPYFPSCP